MLQPRKPLDLSGANEILKTERPPLDLSSAESILKKKESSVSISTTDSQKSVLDGGTNSSVTPASKGFPKIKTFTGLSDAELNKVSSSQSPVPLIDKKLKKHLDTNKENLNRKSALEKELQTVKVTPENQEEISAKTDELSQLTKQQDQQLADSKKRDTQRKNYSKIGALTNHLATGSSQLGVDIASVPELAYEAFAAPQNAIADVFDIPSLRTDSEKFKKTIGVSNAVKDFYKKEVSELRKKSDQTDLKYQDGIYDSFVSGDYSAGFDQLTNSFSESLPATTSVMMGGAAMKAPQLIAASSMMFGAGKNEQLKDENPEMNTNIRVANALAAGLIQGATESLGTGSIGAAAKGIIEREGSKKAVTILKDGLVEYYKKALLKNPLLASMSGEGLEEAFQGVAENAVDVATGAKPADYNIYGSMADDFIGGAFGGAIFGGGLKGLQHISNHQDRNSIKNNNKAVFNLQNELQNPQLSPDIKSEITKNIDALINTNRQLVQKNIEHVESLLPVVREELIKSIGIAETAKETAKQIKLNPDTSDQTKRILLANLQKEYKEANERKVNILEGRITPVEVLSLKEQDKLKKQALKELTQEQNPDASKDITIDNKQITDRANSIYLKQIENEAKQPTTDNENRAEAQPQAEVPQQTKKEKVVDKPTNEQQLEDVKNGNTVTFTYGDKSEIPEIFQDKISSESEINGKKEIKVTIAKSLADYYLKNETQQETQPKTQEQETEQEILKTEGNYPLDTSLSQENGSKVEVNLPQNENLDEKQANGDIVINGDLSTGTGDLGEVRTSEPESIVPQSVPSAIERGTDKKVYGVENKKIKLSANGQAFVVNTKKGLLEVTNSKGEKVSKPTQRKVLRKYADQVDFTQGEKAMEREDFSGDLDSWEQEVSEKSSNPSEIAETIQYAQTQDVSESTIEDRIDYKNKVISENIGKIKPESFYLHGDRKKETSKVAKTYFDDKGDSIDTLSQEMTEAAGIEISAQDVVDFMLDNEGGVKEFLSKDKGSVKTADSKKNASVESLKRKFEQLTGLPANSEYLLKAIEQKNKKSEFDSVLDNMTDEELLEQYNLSKNINNEQQGTTKPDAKGIDEGADNSNGREKSGLQETTAAKKPTTKEKIAQRIRLSDAKIDENSKIVKEKLKAFADMFPHADINPDEYHSNGFSADAIVDMVAKAAKSIAKGGIVTSEHIKEAIKAFNMHFEDEVDFDAVSKKVNPPKKKKKTSDLEAFRDSWNKDTSSGEINQYDSGNTILREHGELRNNQDYEVQKDLDRVQIGIRAIEHSKKLFGAEYVEKTLSFIEQSNLSPEKKAVAYVLLENEMDKRAKDFPDNIAVKKLQDLVRAKSQAFLANSARAIGAGRFRVERFRELVKNGFSEDEFTNAILTSQQIKNKAKIQQLSQVSPDDVNTEDGDQQSDEDFTIEEPKNKRTKEAVKKDISAVISQMRKDLLKVAKGGTAMSSIPYAAQLQVATPHIVKLSKLLAELGGMTTKQIINEVYNDIKDVFPGLNKEDVSNILKNEYQKKSKPNTAEKKENTPKEVVKQALIAKGFSREITITKNKTDDSGNVVKDQDGRNVREKEKRTVLDWKKLAGEAGTIENIRKNVEDALKGSKYSKSQIETMKDALEKEYVRLTADVIEKGLNELQNRNAPRKPVNTKSAAKKLAELYNYGLFDKNKDSYEKIINSVLGFNELDQKAFDEMKQIAKGYAVLMDSGLSDTEVKDAINSLSRRQSRLVATLAFSQADWKFKLAVALSEMTNLSTRFKLVNLGNLAENVSSGMMARAANNMMDAIANGIKGKKTSNKALRAQSKINAKAKLKGITFEASESYGDTSSLLLNHSAVEDYFNNATTNKIYHSLISTYMAKPILEGADSFNKILITEAKMVRAAIKVLEAKGMSNSEALDYVSKSLTGESMKDALVKAKSLIEKVNTDAGKKLLNDSESSVKSLASDIVKESLVSGGKLTETELKAIYNSAYKSAGKDIGHVSNNWVTTQISKVGSDTENRLSEAIKEKNWTVASGEVINQLIWKNFISTFVGGGTNWFIKGLQKSANPLSLISLREDSMRLKMAGELDVTTDEGIKNMEEVLYRGMNLRSTAGTMLMGAIIASSIIGSMMATGADDDIDKWLKQNPWAKKFFDKLVPDAVVLMLAAKDKDFGRYISKAINVKADFFDDQKNMGKIIDKYTKGSIEDNEFKKSKAIGDLGYMLGKRFDFPGPLKAIKDSQQIYKGISKGTYNESDYYTSGFLNGFFQGGIVEKWGLRKDPDFTEEESNNSKSTKEYTPPDMEKESEGPSEKNSETNAKE